MPHSRKPKWGSAEAMACIEARGLRKAFGTTIALDGVAIKNPSESHPPLIQFLA